MKKMTAKEFMEQFDEQDHKGLLSMFELFKDATHLVCAEVLDFNSSLRGQRTAMVIGPSCTYKTVEECEGQWLNDLPSQRQYFTNYCGREELLSYSKLEV